MRTWVVVGAATLTLWGQPASAPEMWEYASGAAGESLRVEAAAMPPAMTRVPLPHRVMRPNATLWYSRELDLAGAAALRVTADDGAQVFVDGVRVVSDGTTFALPAERRGRRGRRGRHRVVVRVLNNAMSGGLNEVEVVRNAPAGRPSPDSSP